MADLIERLKKLNPWKDMDWPEVRNEAAAEIASLRTALSQEREAREKDREHIRKQAESLRHRKERAEAAESSLAEAKRLLKTEVLAVYDECEGVAVPPRRDSVTQVEAYRRTISQLKDRAAARFLAQEAER